MKPQYVPLFCMVQCPTLFECHYVPFCICSNMPNIFPTNITLKQNFVTFLKSTYLQGYIQYLRMGTTDMPYSCTVDSCNKTGRQLPYNEHIYVKHCFSQSSQYDFRWKCKILQEVKPLCDFDKLMENFQSHTKWKKNKISNGSDLVLLCILLHLTSGVFL